MKVIGCWWIRRPENTQWLTLKRVKGTVRETFLESADRELSIP